MRKYNKRKDYVIIKYDPKFRNENGGYLKDEWTAISDIGEEFDSIVFTYEEYIKIENKYVEAVFLTMEYLNSKRIKISHIYKFKDSQKRRLKKYGTPDSAALINSVEIGDVIVEKEKIELIIRLRLRELI